MIIMSLLKPAEGSGGGRCGGGFILISDGQTVVVYGGCGTHHTTRRPLWVGATLLIYCFLFNRIK